MATLYELTSDYQKLLIEYEYSETEAERLDVMERIDALQEDIGDKAEAYARIMKNLQADADMYSTEADRLAKKAKAAKAAVDGLKQRLLTAMETFGATEIKTSIGKWRTQMNPWSCEVTDADSVPAEYHVPQPDKIDRQSIIKHFKETGEILPGCEMIQTTGIRFR